MFVDALDAQMYDEHHRSGRCYLSPAKVTSSLDDELSVLHVTCLFLEFSLGTIMS